MHLSWCFSPPPQPQRVSPRSRCLQNASRCYSVPVAMQEFLPTCHMELLYAYDSGISGSVAVKCDWTLHMLNDGTAPIRKSQSLFRACIPAPFVCCGPKQHCMIILAWVEKEQQMILGTLSALNEYWQHCMLTVISIPTVQQRARYQVVVR